MVKSNPDEQISLRDVVGIIWKRKISILCFVVMLTFLAIVIVVNIDNVYESRAVLKPTQNNTGQLSSIAANLGSLANIAGIDIAGGGNVSAFNTMNSIISSSDFIYSFVKKNNYESKVIEKFDEVENKPDYKNNEKFFIREALKNNLQFNEDPKTKLIVVSFKSKNREFAKSFVTQLVKELSAKYKDLEMSNILKSIDNYKIEMGATDDITLKNKLADVVSGLIQNKVISQAQEYYGFQIVVEPEVPDRLDKVSPKRSLTVIIVFLSAIFIGCISSIIYERIKS